MRLLQSTLTALLLGLPVVAPADVLEIPSPAAASVDPDKPGKGMPMNAVVQRHGAPDKKHPAVGGGSPNQPPITRWDYPGFVVFFEHGHVVDVVVPGQPAPVQHREELQPVQP